MKKAIALSALALACMAGSASAAPLMLPGDSPLYIKFDNLESVNAANNLIVPGGYYQDGMGNDITQGNWGVLLVSTINVGTFSAAQEHNDISNSLPNLYTNTGNGQITGIFYGITLTGPQTATGGYIDLYWQEGAPVSGGCMSGATCGNDASTVTKFTSGTFLTRLAFDTGILPNQNVNIVSSLNPAAQGANGYAESFANVDTSVTGLWTDTLNGNWFNVDPFGPAALATRDVRFRNSFSATVNSWGSPDTTYGDGLLTPFTPGTCANCPAGTFGLASSDPARVFSSPVPEPASLTLLGLGLVGLGYRRRNNKA